MDKLVNIMEEELNQLSSAGLKRRLNLQLLKEIPLKLLRKKRLITNFLPYSLEKVKTVMLSKFLNKLLPSLMISNLVIISMLKLDPTIRLLLTVLSFSDISIHPELISKVN